MYDRGSREEVFEQPKAEMADLVLLSLQLCLASDSRHKLCHRVTGRSDVIRFRALGSLLGR